MSIFEKTEAGSTEVVAKKAGLPFLANSILIMTDGKRSVDDVKKNFGKMGDVDAVYADLERLGFVKRAGGSAAPAKSKPAPAPAPVAPATPAPVAAPAPASLATPTPSSRQYVDRKATINTLRRSLEAALGPGADPIMLRLERAFGEDDFARAISDALRTFAQVRGKSAAAELEAKL